MANNDNIMTFAKLEKRDKEKQSLNQSGQERICINIDLSDPTKLTSDDICKLVDKHFSELTGEQREKYHRIIKKETINGKMLLKIGKEVKFEQIAEILELNLMHTLEFKELLNKILNKKMSGQMDGSTSSETPNEKLNLIQNIENTESVIGIQLNTAKEQTNNTNCKYYKK